MLEICELSLPPSAVNSQNLANKSSFILCVSPVYFVGFHSILQKLWKSNNNLPIYYTEIIQTLSKVFENLKVRILTALRILIASSKIWHKAQLRCVWLKLLILNIWSKPLIFSLFLALGVWEVGIHWIRGAEKCIFNRKYFCLWKTQR